MMNIQNRSFENISVGDLIYLDWSVKGIFLVVDVVVDAHKKGCNVLRVDRDIFSDLKNSRYLRSSVHNPYVRKINV